MLNCVSKFIFKNIKICILLITYFTKGHLMEKYIKRQYFNK